jgi:inner membrane protein
METQNNNNKIHWLKNSIGLKISVIGFIILLLLVPSGMIKDLMRERQTRWKEANEEVTGKWGEQQTIAPIVLTVPCIETIQTKDGKIQTTKYLNILPDELNISGTIMPKKLKRGIFGILVYNSKFKVKGKFGRLQVPEKYNDLELLWNKSFVTIGITDTRGINENVTITINGNTFVTMPGTSDCELFKTGVHATLSFNPEIDHSFEYSMDVNGSGLFSLLPLGKVTKVKLVSDWPHPMFDGSYLPKNREVSDSGFVAEWSVLEHNRDFPQMWLGKASIFHSALGVELIEAVDVYQKSMRAVKYSMLFIILTFLVFLFSELIINRKAHPIQYIMVGAALSIFFSLLIALSEHIHFNMAYLIASIVIISMITLFAKSVFQHTRVSAVVFLVLTILFSFLFVILQLSDYSLILGNIGLLIALAAIMYVSRKIDWYKGKTETYDNQTHP